ncbi:hypothetical protein J3456_10800 [Sulfitobacter sp. NFXS29]|uniref:hypothetical protein n=1 Tax=Sulfitobacter sp. NFXS29 TaxID=2818438 RepID=UPI0032DE36E9
MQWSSDVFSEEETQEVLQFFTPHDVTEKRRSVLSKYLQEIPPPHTDALYTCYCDQLKQAAKRVQETENVDAELWFYALTIRTLSFEVEQQFEGPVKSLLLPQASSRDEVPTQ